MTAQILLAWLKLLALDGDLARAEPKTLRYRVLNAAARLVRGGRRQTLENRRELAMGRGDHPGLAADQRPPGLRLTCPDLSLRPVETLWGLWKPAAPARQPGNRHTRDSKIPAICTADLAVSGSQLPG